MALELRTVFSDVVLDVEDVLAIAKGETDLAAWAGLPMVDLGSFAADSNFESPGLHKRVRACLGAVLSRSGDNVAFEWAQRHISGPSGYRDYDRHRQRGKPRSRVPAVHPGQRVRPQAAPFAGPVSLGRPRRASYGQHRSKYNFEALSWASHRRECGRVLVSSVGQIIRRVWGRLIQLDKHKCHIMSVQVRQSDHLVELSRSWWKLVSVAALFAVMLMLAFVRPAAAWDRTIPLWIHTHTPAAWAGFMRFLDQAGNVGMVVIAILALTAGLLAFRRWREAGFVAATGVAAGLVNIGIKQLVQRPRPDFWPITTDSTYSFPSGHTMMAGVLLLMIVVLAWRTKWRIPAMVAAAGLILLVGFSRLYLGEHYPSDVVGSFCAAILLVVGMRRLVLQRAR